MKIRPQYYRRDGTPYGEDGLLEWAKDFEDREKKIVRQETLLNGRRISTVWLGLDHRFGDGPPLIFETMVFPSSKDFNEEDMERYSTEAEAIAGHQRMVERWKN